MSNVRRKYCRNSFNLNVKKNRRYQNRRINVTLQLLNNYSRKVLSVTISTYLNGRKYCGTVEIPTQKMTSQT